MTFAEVDQRYLELKQQYDAGALSADAFDEQLRALMIQDDQGRWWAKARDSGQWNYFDAATQVWTPSAPPAPVSAAAPPPPPPAQSTNVMPQQTYAQPAPQAYAAPTYNTGQPELSSGLKVVFYILSFLVPIVGVVLFFVYRGKPTQDDRSAANLFLILGVVSFGLSCLCGFMLPAMIGLGNY